MARFSPRLSTGCHPFMPLAVRSTQVLVCRQPQLRAYVRGMALYRVLCDEQLCSDLGVRDPRDDERQHFALPLAEDGE